MTTILIISAPSIPYSSSNKTPLYAAKILGTILGGNMSSRLFQQIREQEGLCYYIGSNHGASEYEGHFYLRAGMDKSKFEFGLQRIYEELEKFVKEGFSDEEFVNAKSYRIGKLQMGIESSDELSEFIGSEYLLHGEINDLQTLIDGYNALTRDDLTPLLQYLEKDNLYTYWIE